MSLIPNFSLCCLALSRIMLYRSFLNIDSFTQKYWFILPSDICDSLILDHGISEGLKLCHPNKATLLLFRKTLFELSLKIEAKRDEVFYIAKRRISLALLILVGVILIIFCKDNIFHAFPSSKLLIYAAVPIFVVIPCIVIFMNYITPVRSGSRLYDSLEILEIRKRIENEFLCFL